MIQRKVFVQHSGATRSLLCSTLFTIGVTVLANSAYAESDATTEEQANEIEEIIVTARYRDEMAQNIGLSMTVMSGDDLAKNNITTFDDLVRATPGLDNISRGPGKNLAAIRGTASTNLNMDYLAQPGLNSVFYDEVALKFIRSSNPELPLFDIQRVEVIKGPQPTYFGEGAVGGSIRFFSNNPDLREVQGRLRAEVSTTAGSDGYNGVVDGSISMPIIGDKLGLRLTAYRDKRDGFIDYTADGVDDANDFKSTGVNAVLLFEPADRFTWRLSTYYSQQAYGYQQTVTGDVDDLTNTLPGFDSRDDTTVLLANKISLTTNNFILESVTGYVDRKYEQQYLDLRATYFTQPNFGITDGFVVSSLELTDKNLSQEFRIVSTFDSRVNFVGGVLYVDSDSLTFGDSRTNSAIYQALLGTDLFVGINIPYDGKQLSVVGELQLSFLNDKLRASAGARYFDQEYVTSLRKPFAAAPIMAVFGAPAIFDSEAMGADELGGSVNEVLPRIQAEYDIKDNVMVFGSAAKGARSGLYNNPATLFLLGIRATDPEFDELFAYDPDELWSYELGIKSTLMNGAVRANVSLYYTDWKNMQVSRTVGIFPLVGNVADSTIKGLEWDLYWAVNEYFSVFTAGSIQKARFDGEVPLLTFGGPPLETAPKGTRIPQVAERSYALGLEGRYPNVLEGLDLVSNLSYSHTGDRLNMLEVGKLDQMVPALDLVNVRIGLEQEAWSIFLYANNLLNDIEPTFFSDVSVDTLEFVNTPRTVGLTYRRNF
jgi:iron complex outermembrane receptor protein